MTEPAAAIPAYGLAAPTEEDALALLARALGPDGAAATWRTACAAVRVPCPAPAPDAGQLLRVCEHLSRMDGITGVVGNALAVRARVYVLLWQQQQTEPRP